MKHWIYKMLSIFKDFFFLGQILSEKGRKISWWRAVYRHVKHLDMIHIRGMCKRWASKMVRKFKFFKKIVYSSKTLKICPSFMHYLCTTRSPSTTISHQLFTKSNPDSLLIGSTLTKMKFLNVTTICSLDRT